MAEGYQMNFNQDFTSISVLNTSTGFRLFSISSTDQVEEIYAKENEHIRLVERFFNSSLVVLVTSQKPNCLKMLHFKKKQDICNCVYPSDILCVRMSRHRMVVCLAESIHIQDIRDMGIIHSIENIAPNQLGLCALSVNSQLAFPICSTSGELRIFDAYKLKSGATVKAHNTALSALCFTANGTLLATASERGTVIRVFCVRNGQRVQEFRRGVKRCVRIASLLFSGNYLCVSSNTETVHIFKIDAKVVEAAERKTLIAATEAAKPAAEAAVKSEKLEKATPTKSAKAAEVTASKAEEEATSSSVTVSGSTGSGWSDYLSKAVSSYLIPTQVSDVLAQDRAFATATLSQPGLKHVCGLRRLQKDMKLLIACEDGFLHVYDFNVERGGPCKLERVHDLRYALEDVIELNLTDSMSQLTSSPGNTSNTSTPTSPKTASISNLSGKEPISSRARPGSVIIENPDPAPDHSYAGILKGDQTTNTLSDSAKFRKLCDAIDTPTKLYDEQQFPPVAIAARE